MKARLPLDEGEKRRLVLKLLGQLRCLECGQQYDRRDFTLMHRWEEIWLLSSHCRQCDEINHVIILMRLDAEPELVTDLTPEEMEEAEDWAPITSDDVLDIHLWLEAFDGSPEELFSG
jgi:hypothetical protein